MNALAPQLHVPNKVHQLIVVLAGSIPHLIQDTSIQHPSSNIQKSPIGFVLWYVIAAHSHIRGNTTGVCCRYGSC